MKNKNEYAIHSQRSRRFRYQSALAVMVAALVSLTFGCTSPFNPGGGGPAGSLGDLMDHLGGIRISRVTGTETGGGSLFRTQSVLPSVAIDDVKALRITLDNGPEDADPIIHVVRDPSLDENGVLADPVEITDVIPGDWTLTVEALDETETLVLLRGTNGITISAGEFTDLTTVTVGLVDIADQPGTYELTITWPSEDDPDYPITDVVDEVWWRIGDGPEWGGSIPVGGQNGQDAVHGIELINTLSPGNHMFTVELRAAGKPEPYSVVARYDEIWRIASNAKTIGRVDFTAQDFAYGGGARIGVNIDLPDDLETFFQGTPDSTVIAGESYIIDAATIGSVTTLQWRVDGEEVKAGPPGDAGTLTIETSEGEAGKVLLIVLVVTDTDGNVYSGAHRVRIVAPGAPAQD